MIRRTFLPTALLAALLAAPLGAQEPPPEPKAPEPLEAGAELLPVPRIAVRSVFVEMRDNGYEIFLSRSASEKLAALLALTKDNEGDLAEMIRNVHGLQR